MGAIETNAERILEFLADQPSDLGWQSAITGQQVVDHTGIEPADVNDAVTILVEGGLAEWLQTLGTAPFNFRQVQITPRGRYELERAQDASDRADPQRPMRTPSPIGSPFGFSDIDWEIVSERKARVDVLYVVLGHQFDSNHFERAALRSNIEEMFSVAVDAYNERPGNYPVQLDFKALAAGYGDHLFNEIARDVISADIAVFETSDLNPNVMLEMGVALTWGARVLPIKHEGTDKPPSDISGQTWADYVENASQFTDPDHEFKLVEMVERAARKKGA
jgi:hypothetical protein